MKLIPITDLTPADLEAWERLAEEASEPNPFFEPTFVLAAARAFADEAPQLLVLERGGEWLGAVPVADQSRLGGALSVLGTWEHPYSFLGTPLVSRGRIAEFAAALIESAAEREHGRFLLLKRSHEGAVLGAIRAAIDADSRTAVAYELSFERALLERRPGEDYLDGIRPKRRRELSRLRRRLGEELGGDSPAETVDRSEDTEAPADFLRLEASGWKGREGTAMAARDADAGLLREVCDGFRERGRLQVLALESGGQPAAMKINVSAGNTVFCFKIAYDERLGRYSPGILLEIDNVHLFHARRDEPLMDSCAQPDNKMINRLWPDRRPISRLMIGPAGPSGTLLRIAREGARKLRRSDSD